MVKKTSNLFQPINENEAEILGAMMNSEELEFYNSPQIAERRLPEGIPFILCMAKAQNRHYVYRKNTNFLPTILKICKNWDIKCIEVEEYFLVAGKND